MSRSSEDTQRKRARLETTDDFHDSQGFNLLEAECVIESEQGPDPTNSEPGLGPEPGLHLEPSFGREPGSCLLEPSIESESASCSRLSLELEPRPQFEPRFESESGSRSEPSFEPEQRSHLEPRLRPEPGPETPEPKIQREAELMAAPGLYLDRETAEYPIPAINNKPAFRENTLNVDEVIPEVSLPLEPDPTPEPGEPIIEMDLNKILDQVLLEDDDKELEIDDGVPYDQEIDINDKHQPLFSEASLTLHQSFVSILTLVLAFKLSGVCLKYVLSLISLHLPKQNIFKSSLSYFKKYFAHLQVKKDYQYFCSVCFVKCAGKSGCVNHVGAKLCYLVKLPLIPQLQMLFSREGFYKNLKFDHASHAGNYSDIHDGDVYQRGIKDGYLGSDGKISLEWYTDGMALYQSSNTCVWPFYLKINELPYKDRCKKENLLLPLLWVGPVKPPANIIISEVYPDLKVLASGVKMNIPNVGERVVKGRVISGSGDTPARSIMMNIVQFNGASSCQRCEQPGEPRIDNAGVRIFPYKPEEMFPRTVERVLQFGAMALPKKPCMGVKRVPGLNLIMPDCVHGVSIDPMHLLYGGVCKKVLHLLTAKSHSQQKYSIASKWDTINDRLLTIRPPAHTPRTPRSLSELAYWKMKELKSFLNDYSLPILKDLVPNQYLKHHASLVAAVQLLSANVVSIQSLDLAKQLLHKYVSQLPDLYSQRMMTINFHLLLHLHEVVQDLGPLWVYTCFPMEDVNGIILNLVHGTRWAEHQIGDSVLTCLALPELVRNLHDSSAREFCKNVLDRNKCVTYDKVGRSKIVGKSSQLQITPSGLQGIIDVNVNKVYEVGSIKRGIFIYVASSKLSPSSRRDSTAAAFEWENCVNVGLIKNFYRIFRCNCLEICSCESNILAHIQNLKVISEFPTLIDDVYVPNIAQYSESDDSVLIDAECLHGVCTKIEFDGKLFVSKPLNSQEIE